MASKAALKRPAGAAVKAEAKKPRKAAAVALPKQAPEVTVTVSAPTSTKEDTSPALLAQKPGCPPEALAGVIDGLSKAVHLSDSCRAMLLSLVPTSVCIPKETRSVQQAMVVDMIGQTLKEVSLQLQQSIDSAQTTVGDADKTKSELAEQVSSAEGVVANAQESVSEKRAALEEVTKALASAKQALAEKQKQHKANGSALDKANAELSKVETIFTRDFSVVKEGRWEKPSELKKHQSVLEGTLKKLQVEESMLAALPSVFAKKPDQRGTFDIMLLTECEQRLQKKIEEVKEQVQSLSAAAAATGEPLELAKVELEAALVSQAAAADSLSGADEAAREAGATLRACEDALTQACNTAKAAAAEVAKRQMRLKAFEEASLKGFNILEDHKESGPTGEEGQVDCTVEEPMEAKDMVEHAEEGETIEKVDCTVELPTEAQDMVEHVAGVVEEGEAIEKAQPDVVMAA